MQTSFFSTVEHTGCLTTIQAGLDDIFTNRIHEVSVDKDNELITVDFGTKDADGNYLTDLSEENRQVANSILNQWQDLVEAHSGRAGYLVCLSRDIGHLAADTTLGLIPVYGEGVYGYVFTYVLI